MRFARGVLALLDIFSASSISRRRDIMSDDHGLEAARSEFEKIAGLVLALQSADVFARQEAEERIHEDALGVMIRSSWHAPGRDGVDVPIEYCIMLCTAGPAVRIVGDLNKYGEPVSARIEHQDWFNPFVTWVGNCSSVEKILLAYARCFNFVAVLYRADTQG